MWYLRIEDSVLAAAAHALKLERCISTALRKDDSKLVKPSIVLKIKKRIEDFSFKVKVWQKKLEAEQILVWNG